MKITVPATSANIGPGFDSVGVAVSKYLTIEVLEPADKWEVLHDLGDVPSDENNLLIATALQVKANLTPHRIKMISDIPLARGLGSSSSVIVAGIELANQLADLNLSDDEKLTLATKIEGHPDNVAPAIFGGFTVSLLNDGIPDCFSFMPRIPLNLVVAVPDFHLSTKAARSALPLEVPLKDAVFNVGRAALLVGAL
ncbi:homoserine kinase, partial [uncultured Streptococcus sp.]|uniref:homoserine kinase n=1 Tax=uncultured Streptococcus sp. TaxID=83427 RepID=UPI0025909288